MLSKKIKQILSLVLILSFLFTACPVYAASAGNEGEDPDPLTLNTEVGTSVGEVPVSTLDLKDIPAYDGTPFVAINDNMPDFYIWQIFSDQFIHFSSLDDLGRTGAGMAILGQETFPTESRSQISSITPSGWQSSQYEGLIDQDYLYNRMQNMK